MLDLRPIGMRGGTTLRVVAEDLPELLCLRVGRILNLNGATLCDHLSCSVWPCYASKTRALVKISEVK